MTVGTGDRRGWRICYCGQRIYMTMHGDIPMTHARSKRHQEAQPKREGTVATPPKLPSEAQIDLLQLIEKRGSLGADWGDIGDRFSMGRRSPRYLEAARLDRVAKALLRRDAYEETPFGPRITATGRAILAAL